MKLKPLLSIVIPLYNEELVLEPLQMRLMALMNDRQVPLGSRDGQRRQHRPHAREGAAALPAGPAVPRDQLLAQLRPSDRDHRRDGQGGRRCRGHHRRGPAGSAGGHPADGRQVARRLRRGLRRPDQARRGRALQAGDRGDLLPPAETRDQRRHPRRHGGFPPHGSARRQPADDHAREVPLRARHGELGGLQAVQGRVRARRARTRGRRSTRCRRCCGSRSTACCRSRTCR